MTDLAAWLTAQLDHDEQIARRAAASHGGTDTWYFVTTVDHVHGEGATYALDLGDRTVLPSYDDDDSPWLPAELEHIALHDPARVHRDVAAHRRILAWCVEVIGDRDLSRYGTPGLLA